jgi:sulfatase maturation enzyme AslB (radical SAM superfamily)
MIETDFYKGFYLITAKCNLSCSYCVLENSPEQIKQELNLSLKKELIYHLYNHLNFRSLTLSGGEPLLMGENAPYDFELLLQFIKQFKSTDSRKNLRIHLYTNGTCLSNSLADLMKGVVDEISINIDSPKNEVLKCIGRSKNVDDNYFNSFLNSCRILAKREIPIKLHSVVCSLNYQSIGLNSKLIFDKLIDEGIRISSWKFYQYMSYDVDFIDMRHFISADCFDTVKEDVANIFNGYEINLHFKGNKEMNESLFNILPYGNVQYMCPNDTWSSSKRTKSLLEYQSMNQFFNENSISESLFKKYHTLDSI